MQTRFSILFIVACLFLSSCNHQDKANADDTSTVINEVTIAEKQLFFLLKEGKLDDAFNMHLNNTEYRSIREGEVRNFAEVQKILKENTAKGIKGYDWQISSRDFLVINETSVLETLNAQRTVVTDSTNLASTGQWIMSTLWQKKDGKWLVAYVHSSTKK
jgi:hypothetical protein